MKLVEKVAHICALTRKAVNMNIEESLEEKEENVVGKLEDGINVM